MKTVLIVDDIASNRKLLALLLARVGYACQMAADAAEARQLFAAQVPYAVITDCQMPHEDGIALARSLRQLAADRPFRMALLTGDERTVTPEAALFDRILTKPVTVEELKSFLEDEPS